MQSLISGFYTEDFNYGYPYDQVIRPRPPQFDYSGQTLTSQGLVVCPQQKFSIEYGSGLDNPDIGQPFAGPISGNPYYLRFPVLTWSGVAGMFLTVTTSAPTTLGFDRAFSGHVKDRFVVTVNDTERVNITNSAGYAWTHTDIPLGRGVYKIAIVLLAAAYDTSGVVREGTAQQSATTTDIKRSLRITNFKIGSVAALPTADSQQLNAVGGATLTVTPSITVMSGSVPMVGTSAIIYPAKLSGPVSMTGVSTFTANVPTTVARVSATMAATSSLTCTPTIGNRATSTSGGWGMTSNGALTVRGPALKITDLLRPLKSVSLAMTRPVIVSGRPHTMVGMCETEVATELRSGLVLSRVDPYSTANQIPATVGSATYRWLSIDAQRDPTTLECLEWHAKDNYSGPYWSTPGAYRPNVDNFVMKVANRVEKVAYPSVQFDSGHLDHLNITLPNASSTGAQTWVFVGSFTRFRGDLYDSLPLIDFQSSQTVDYNSPTEEVAIRGAFQPWLDTDNKPSMYLGLTSYSPAEPTTSRIAWRSNDSTKSFSRSELLVIADNVPVVLIFSLDGQNSRAYLTPLVSSGAGTTTSMPMPRTAVNSTIKSFSLGRARIAPPFAGTFLTGSMSLLEVTYYNRALTQTQATTLSSFLSGLYAPVTINRIADDYTEGATNADGEQMLIYADNPETYLALVSGDRAVPLGIYPSTPEGQAEIDRFNAQGVPTVLCTNRDYSALLAKLERE